MPRALVILALLAGCAASHDTKMESVDPRTGQTTGQPPPPPPPPPQGIPPEYVRLSKLEPPSECQMRGVVAATWVFRYEDGIRQLQEKASKQFGNWITLDGPLNGRVFFCPWAALEAMDAQRRAGAPPPPAATGGCEPECSPGYTCVRGQCVEACNPRCVAPQRCGADRICH